MSKNDANFSHKVRGVLLGPLGMTWLPRRELAAITRGESFHRLEQGGRWFFVAPVVERIAFTLDVLPDEMRFSVPNVQTLDGILVTMTLKLEFMLDPFKCPAERHGWIAKRCKDRSERRVILADQAQRALQEVVSRYPVAAVCAAGVTWSSLEAQVWPALDALLNSEFGLFLFRERCSIQEVIPPPGLAQRLEISAQRRIEQADLRQLSPAEYNAILRGEAIEAMKGMTSGSPYVSVPDLTDPSASAPAHPPPLPLSPPTQTPPPPSPPADVPPPADGPDGTQPRRPPRSMIDE